MHDGATTLRRPRWPVVAVLGTLVACASVGCAGTKVQSRRMPAWVFEAGRTERVPAGRAHPRGGMRGRSPAADLVTAALQDTGLRFGTDGSVAALWGYLHGSHIVVAPAEARAGDALFFESATRPTGATCTWPDHAGLVTAIDRDGRLSFVEVRGGRTRRSYVDPQSPHLRRDAAGKVRNTFLRAKTIDEPPDLPIFAGEMLCGVARARPPLP